MDVPLSFVTEWLLDRSGPLHWRQAVQSDLRHARSAGCSAALVELRAGWHLARRIGREVRQHKWSALSGVAVGWLALACVGGALTWVATTFGGPSVHANRWQLPQYIVVLTVGFLYAAASGWIVGRLHGTQTVAAVFGYLGSVLVLTIVAVPLYYFLAPSLFASILVPHMSLYAVAMLLAPLSIVAGGLRRPRIDAAA